MPETSVLESPPDLESSFEVESAVMTPFQQKQWERSQKINANIRSVTDSTLKPEQRGSAWREALRLGSSDPKMIKQAGRVFSSSLQRFEQRGEAAVKEIRSFELNELAQTDFDLALSVREGAVSREAALIISKAFGKQLNPEQISELSGAFVARQSEEKLEEFEIRRRAQIAGLKKMHGKSEKETWGMKRKVEDALAVYNLLEAGVINKTKWPKREQDGQIRRSFINRSAVLDVALDVLDDIHSCFDLDKKKEEIEKGSRIPKEIKNLEEIAEIVEERGDIKAVTFDMFDTLVQWTSNGRERHNLMSEGAARILQKHGINITSQEYDSIRNPIWYGVKKTKTDKGQEFKAVEVLTKIVEKVASQKRVKLNPDQYRQIAEELEESFIDVDAETAVPMPGGIDTLRALKEKGIKIAVISNHPYNNHSVNALLRKYGLLKYIDNVVVFSDVGYLKSPLDKNSTIFKAALKQLGEEAGSVIHVGDNHDADQKAPSQLGLRGIVYNNPTSTQKRVHNKSLSVGSKEYQDVSMNAYKEASQLNAKSYYNGNKPELAAPELEPYALRFYELTRDNYAPLMIKFAEYNLDKLKDDPELLNLCVGRDGLASFLVQRKLLELFPEKYGSIDAKRVQYTPVSRNLVDHADRDSLSTFFDKTGFGQSKKINIVDNGIAGSTQDRIVELFPEKNIQGSYLISRKFRDDPNKDKKFGLLLETDSVRRPGTKGLSVHGLKDLAFTGGLASNEMKRLFLSRDFVHTQEDVWNGIFDSADPLEEKHVRMWTDEKGTDQTIIKPKNWKPEIGQKRMGYIPGNRDAIPTLNVDSYLVFKKMGLKGIIDGVHMYRRQTQLGMDYSPEHSINLLGNWFKKANDDKRGGIDNDLVRAMVRLKV